MFIVKDHLKKGGFKSKVYFTNSVYSMLVNKTCGDRNPKELNMNFWNRPFLK